MTQEEAGAQCSDIFHTPLAQCITENLELSSSSNVKTLSRKKKKISLLPFFSPSAPFPYIYNRAICWKMFFFLSFTSITPPPPTFNWSFSIYSTNILLFFCSVCMLPACPSSIPLSLSLPLSFSLCLFSLVIVSWALHWARAAGRQKLDRASTLPLPSGWDSFSPRTRLTCAAFSPHSTLPH